MKMMKRAALVMTCVFALGMGTSLAAENAAVLQTPVQAQEFDVNPEVMRAPEIQHISGTIVEISGDRVTVQENNQKFAVETIVSEATYVVNGENGKLRRPSALKVGQHVEAYVSSAMTRSLPPQARAYALVFGDVEKVLPMYFEVAQVLPAEDGNGVRVLNKNNDIIATIDKNACEDYNKIQQGDKLLVWSNAMTMSLPAQTNADKVVILP